MTRSISNTFSGRTLCLTLTVLLATTLASPGALADDWFYYPPELKADLDDWRKTRKEPPVEETEAHEPTVRVKPARIKRTFPVQRDFATFSISVLVGMHLGLRVFSRTYDNFRFTAFDMGIHMDAIAGSISDNHGADSVSHIGPTFCIGRRSGERGQSGNWFMTGAWYGSGSVGPDNSGYTFGGLYIPLGWEFTHHFGKEDSTVWGFRAYGAIRPLGKCEEDKWSGDDGAVLGLFSGGEDWRSLPKIFFASDLFIGF